MTTTINPTKVPRALTVAGSDCGGGAGIQADLKTFTALATYGMSVLTALTAQNTLGVTGIHAVPEDFVRAQFMAVVSDLGVDAMKTGMLFSASLIETVADLVRTTQIPYLVVDPVMVATSGAHLLAPDAVSALVASLLPLATLITPNAPEADVLLQHVPDRSPDLPERIRSIADMKLAAAALHTLGPRYVLIKGGHLALDPVTLAPLGDGDAEATAQDGIVIDVLYDGVTREYTLFKSSRVKTLNTHGTGCTLSAAITALLASGATVPDAVRRGVAYTHQAIVHALPLGQGHGPLNHAFHLRSATAATALLEDYLPGPEGYVDESVANGKVVAVADEEQVEAVAEDRVVVLGDYGWRVESRLIPTQLSFVQLLKNACSAEWHAYTKHKFVLGMADGTLPEASFRHYLTQDYIFLTHFARCNALAAYKAQSMADTVFSAEIVCHIARESQLHVDYCAEWGISKAELSATKEARPNLAYTRFTLDRGMAGDLLDLRAALAPCLLGYGDIGMDLYTSEATVKDHEKNRYWKWICNYADNDYQQAVRDGEVLLERLAVEYGVWHAPKRIEALVETFRKATVLECGFWEMGWNVEW
ncbi:hypothetical protein GGF32_006097 [Allomyces javanicus]|nr:hypothetical protein GGF32_006097 [Allomyces javanicus]